MKKNIRNTAHAVIVAVLISFTTADCAGSMATQEELTRLETIDAEIQILEQQKNVLQKEYDTLVTSIGNKEFQLGNINRRKSVLELAN